MGNIIVGIDIGTSKICTLIGFVNNDKQLEIIGKGFTPCTGIKKGIIIDIESTSNAIRSSVAQAETMANLRVSSAYVNIYGMHVTIINNRCCINISSENKQITKKDIEKVLNLACNMDVPEDRQIISIVPRQYTIDGYDEIVDPVGMVGTKLEADVDVVLGKIISVQNIIRSMERANLKVDGFIVETMAAAELLLTPQEKEIGVILIDIGGGVTEVSYYRNKKLVYNNTIPVGGDHITNDISIGLKIPYNEAEKIKRQYELALSSLIKNDQEIMVSEINDSVKKTVKVSKIIEIIEARVYEIFSISNDLLMKFNVNNACGAGVILTGGGISYIDGGMQMAYEIFNLPVRVASIKIPGISKNEYATAAGIIKYISNFRKKYSMEGEIETKKPDAAKEYKKTGFFEKLLKLMG